MIDEQPTILLVDDDPVNLEILEERLDKVGYLTIKANSGEEAWEHLQQDPLPFQAVLLDRMMPGMDGMTLLGKIKACKSLSSLPIIMQTAAASPDQIRDGIQAGAYYYLTKPFAKEVLVAIVKSAVDDFFRNQSLQRELIEQSTVAHRLHSAEFQYQTMEDARVLALFLAQTCPEPNRVVIGLLDLLLNAVEHGNLDLSYEDKTRLQKDGQWETEIARRLQLPEFVHKLATVQVHRHPEAIEFTIRDQGRGFDWMPYLEMNPNLAFASHGRGIAMARALSFDSLEYRGVGNEVVCTINVTPDSLNATPHNEALMATQCQ